MKRILAAPAHAGCNQGGRASRIRGLVITAERDEYFWGTLDGLGQECLSYLARAGGFTLSYCCKDIFDVAIDRVI